jgi:tetratricopeptide (TPR) repeat protein
MIWWHRLAFGVVILGCACGKAAAQPPGTGATAIEKSTTFVLLLNKAVQEDLQLDPAQRDRLRQLPDDIRSRHAKQRDALQHQLKKAQERSAKAQAEFYKGVDEAVARVLKPEQVKRLKQIEVQIQGLALFEDPGAVEALGLTLRQREDFAKVVADLNKTQTELVARGGRNTGQELAKLSQTAFRSVAAGLTDEQKKILKALVGEPSQLVGRAPPIGLGGHLPDSLRRSLRVGILTSPDVAGELKLEEEQKEGLKTALQELQTSAKKTLTAAQGPLLLMQLSQLEQKIVDEARAEAEEKVLKPAQKGRLDQLALQARGLPVFEDVAVLNAVKLTPEQAKAVEDASKKIAQKRQEFVKELGKAKLELPEARDRWNRQEGQLNQEAVAGLVAGFDDAQKQIWEQRTGKTVDLVKAEIYPALVRGPVFVPPPGTGVAEVSPARAYMNEGNVAYLRGEFDKALAGFDECLRLDQDHAGACNSKAWLLATCPEEKLRDGLEAIRLAKKACTLTQDKVAAYVDTLAAAYAEAGEFEEALTTQTRALELAAPQERAEFAMRLKLFQEKKKYRETPVKGVP